MARNGASTIDADGDFAGSSTPISSRMPADGAAHRGRRTHNRRRHAGGLRLLARGNAADHAADRSGPGRLVLGRSAARRHATIRSPSSIRIEFRSAPGSTLSERFLRLIDRSTLMQDCRDAELIAPVRAIDATPYLARRLRRAEQDPAGRRGAGDRSDFLERRSEGDPDRALRRHRRQHAAAPAGVDRGRSGFLSRATARCVGTASPLGRRALSRRRRAQRSSILAQSRGRRRQADQPPLPPFDARALAAHARSSCRASWNSSARPACRAILSASHRRCIIRASTARWSSSAVASWRRCCKTLPPGKTPLQIAAVLVEPHAARIRDGDRRLAGQSRHPGRAASTSAERRHESSAAFGMAQVARSRATSRDLRGE